MEVALITGCATGLGRALAGELNARRLSGGGKAFKVYATDYRLHAIRDLEADGISTLELDVRDEKSIKAAVDTVLSREDRIDLLVCNAGVSTAGWLVEVPLDDVRKVFDVNVFGVFRVIQAVAPSMMDRRRGKIATLCSVLSYTALPFGGPYSGSKAALAMMTEALRIEVEPFGVTVTSIVPGYCKSRILPDAVVAYDRYDDSSSQYHKLTPQVRKSRAFAMQQGITAEAAARDIGDCLAKPKPKRFVYTGASRLYFLIVGFLQTWVCGGIIAWLLQRKSLLNHKDKLGRAGINPQSRPGAKGVPLSARKEE